MDAATSRPGRLGDYELLETLAVGPRWRTYKGFDPGLHRTVVLKSISRNLLGSHAELARFADDVRAAARLDHPNIVKVLEYGEDSGAAFVAMEYVEGWALKERVRIPIKDTVALVGQLLEALDYAHARGVAHHDIKPSNLLLTSTGLRVSGFGFASLASASPDYMSPEQFADLPADGRSDVFSTGIIFYELLTGVSPFAGPSVTLAERVCKHRERSPSDVNAEIPPVFDPVCAKALAKAVNDRYATAGAFCDSIRDAYQAIHGAQPSRVVSNETVLAASAVRELPGNSGAVASVAASPAVSPEAAHNWDEETLRAVERQLAAFVGPVARIIVKKAALKATDLDKLYALAAEHLQHQEERRAFLAGKAEISRRGAPRATPQIAHTQISPPASAAPIEHSSPPVPKPQSSVETKSAAPRSFPNPEARPEAKPATNPAPKAEANVTGRRPSAPAAPAAKASSPWEELLGKQPENLAGYLKDRPPELDDVIHAFVATVDALAALHAENARIEPLSPQSICFDRQGNVIIRASQGGATPPTGNVVSNPRYAVPESFAEKGIATESMIVAAQVYALGFMFYEIFLGKKLFDKTFAQQRSDLDWLRWHADLEAKAPALKSLLPECPAALSDLLEGMLEKRAEKRTADLKKIASGLRGVAQRANKTVMLHKAGKAAPGKAPAETQSIARERSRRMLLLALLFIVALIAGGFFAWHYPDMYQAVVTRISNLYHRAQTP